MIYSKIAQKTIFSKKRNVGFLPTGLMGQIAHFWELCCSHKVLHHDVNAQGLEECLGCLMGMSLIVQQILKIITRIVIKK